MDPIAFDVIGSVKACIPYGQRIGPFTPAHFLADATYAHVVIVTAAMQADLADEMIEGYRNAPPGRNTQGGGA